MARTALDLITASLKRLNVLSGIETPTADLAKDALERLNDLIETWSTESLTLWANQIFPIALVSGRDKYRLGVPTPPATSDLGFRPDRILGVNLVLQGPQFLEVPLVPYDEDDWRLQQAKLTTTTQPTHYHYDPAWPLGELWIWPIFSEIGRAHV